MAFLVYSAEALPRTGLGEYKEYIRYNSFIIGPIEAGKWFTIQKFYSTIVHRDYEDIAGTAKVVTEDDVAQFINDNWTARGIVALSGEDYADEAKRTKAEQNSKAQNLVFRQNTLRSFERQLEAYKIGKPGRAETSPYEEECYEILGWPKPNSVEALRAARMPGEETAQRIATAIEAALGNRPQSAVGMDREEITKGGKEDGRHTSAQHHRDKVS